MTKQLPEIDPRHISKLVIAAPKDVLYEARQNAGWLAFALALIITVMALSAWAAASLDVGFIITSNTTGEAAGVAQRLAKLDYPAAFYFTVINMTTVGFGDIIPASTAARTLAIFNSLFGLIVFAGFVSLIMMAFSPSGGSTLGEFELRKAGPATSGDTGDRKQPVVGDSCRLRDLVIEQLRVRIAEILEKAEAENGAPCEPDAAGKLGGLRVDLGNLLAETDKLVSNVELFDQISANVLSAYRNRVDVKTKI